MNEETILAHAEALANLNGTSFDEAEAEVRAMLKDDMTYSEQDGWRVICRMQQDGIQ